MECQVLGRELMLDSLGLIFKPDEDDSMMDIGIISF